MIKSVTIIALFFTVFYYHGQLQEYDVWMRKAEWAVDTMKINVAHRRDMLRACKRFGWCDENHSIPAWETSWRGEWNYRL